MPLEATAVNGSFLFQSDPTKNKFVGNAKYYVKLRMNYKNGVGTPQELYSGEERFVIVK
ncbi:MAG: hypothetical protein K2X87_21580 [Gemmataceae bacterium]|nr:hypothetical protein [Gemmataceae bacterium]